MNRLGPWRELLWIWILVTALSSAAACDSSQPKLAVGGSPVPAELQAGETKFNANCSACHGQRGVGTPQGPPLVHKIYEPNHHGDAAFQRAAASGVNAHHWQFGNMPKIDSVTPADVDQIIQYVRWLQRQAGIS
jgi:mono/diheme cytochrome c family protein